MERDRRVVDIGASDPVDERDGAEPEDEPVFDQDADFAQEHASLTVDDFPLDRPLT